MVRIGIDGLHRASDQAKGRVLTGLPFSRGDRHCLSNVVRVKRALRAGSAGGGTGQSPPVSQLGWVRIGLLRR